ncbi:MAG: S8 family peptidase [Saprospiraceae bacterium]|nr:S8 family peptidase [Saprospiraceae bacterium]
MITLKKAGVLWSVLICLLGPGSIGAQSPSNRLTGQYLLKDTVYKLVSGRHENIVPVLQSLHCRILNQYPLDTFLLVYFTPMREIKLSDHPEWQVYRCPAPHEELWIKRMDATVNYINAAHQTFPDELGQGIRASVKEFLFDTTDIDLRPAYRYSPTQLPVVQTHSTIMATLIGGRGNTAPSSTGVAPELELSSSGFVLPLPDTGDFYSRSNTTVQNHSYGVEINNEYSPEAYAFDLSVWNNPSLLHVFSSGNQGGESSTSGKYNGIQGYANLSGSFKMSKNTLSVGAIDSMDVLESRSSRGPAFDGRIKPEMVAFGIEGTSGAAALVTGAASLIQQVYKKDHNNELPPAALTKAILINCALDLGNPGPDYGNGYGKLNVLHALKTTISRRYILDQLIQGQNNQHSILIPDKVKNLKFTLVWQEQPGTLFADHVMRNDLDLVVTDPLSGMSIYPWILSIHPDKDSLSKPAIRGVDHVNTAEQITMEYPPAGLIQVSVSGKLKEGSQNYAIAYDWEIRDQMTWTFPQAKDILKAGKTNTLRWISSFENNTTSNLEYSLDSQRWNTIHRAIDLENGSWQWVVPDTNAVIFLRHLIGDQIYTTKSMVTRELNLQVGFVCGDSVAVYWDRMPGIDRYQVYLPDSGQMKVVRETEDTFYSFKIQPLSFIAIGPVINKYAGTRYPSMNYQNQGVSCYVKQFLAQKITEVKANLILSLGTGFDIKNLAIDQVTSTDLITVLNQNHPVLTAYSLDVSLEEGINRFVLRILLNNGKLIRDTINLFSLGDRVAAIYPNPGRQGQSINILAQKVVITQVLIHDLQGRLILSEKGSNINSIELPDLIPGVYILSLLDGRKMVFQKKLVIY